MKEDGTDWTGTGSFYIALTIDESSFYVYTNGAELGTLGILSVDDIAKLPKYSFSSTESTIPFGKFKDVSSLFGGGGGE
jgi:hypothetical protein